MLLKFPFARIFINITFFLFCVLYISAPKHLTWLRIYCIIMKVYTNINLFNLELTHIGFQFVGYHTRNKKYKIKDLFLLWRVFVWSFWRRQKNLNSSYFYFFYFFYNSKFYKKKLFYNTKFSELATLYLQ